MELRYIISVVDTGADAFFYKPLAVCTDKQAAIDHARMFALKKAVETTPSEEDHLESLKRLEDAKLALGDALKSRDVNSIMSAENAVHDLEGEVEEVRAIINNNGLTTNENEIDLPLPRDEVVYAVKPIYSNDVFFVSPVPSY